MSRVSDAFIDRLVAKVTEGFGGDVGVVPRQFLRQLVDVMDLVDVEEDYDPEKAYGFTAGPLVALSPEEQAARDGRRAATAAASARRPRPRRAPTTTTGPVPEVQVW
jgi:hypothetical protein